MPFFWRHTNSVLGAGAVVAALAVDQRCRDSFHPFHLGLLRWFETEVVKWLHTIFLYIFALISMNYHYTQQTPLFFVLHIHVEDH